MPLTSAVRDLSFSLYQIFFQMSNRSCLPWVSFFGSPLIFSFSAPFMWFFIFWLFPLSSSSRDPLLILSWAISPPGTSGSGNFIKVWQLSRFAQLRFTKPTAQLLYQSNLKPRQHIHSIATKYIPIPALELWKTGSFNQRSPNFIHEATVLKYLPLSISLSRLKTHKWSMIDIVLQKKALNPIIARPSLPLSIWDLIGVTLAEEDANS